MGENKAKYLKKNTTEFVLDLYNCGKRSFIEENQGIRETNFAYSGIVYFRRQSNCHQRVGRKRKFKVSRLRQYLNNNLKL